MALQVGDRLTLGDRFSGTVRYIGKIRAREGRWIGLELDDAVGANDGSVGGMRYFQCMEKHGIFVRYEKIRGGLVCESGEKSEQRHELKIRKLEETIRMLRDAEKNEILELRRENDSIKSVILRLQERLDGRDSLKAVDSSRMHEMKRLVDESRMQIQEAMDAVLDMERCIQKSLQRRSAVDRGERGRVLFLVGQIVDGVLDGNAEKTGHLMEEFRGILGKYGICVE